jgi:hypothetical protein
MKHFGALESNIGSQKKRRKQNTEPAADWIASVLLQLPLRPQAPLASWQLANYRTAIVSQSLGHL